MSTQGQGPQNHSNNSNVPSSLNGSISTISGITRGSIPVIKSSAAKSATSNLHLPNHSRVMNKTKPHQGDVLHTEGVFKKSVSDKTFSPKELSEKPISQNTITQNTLSKSTSISIADAREELMLLISELEELIEYNE